MEKQPILQELHLHNYRNFKELALNFTQSLVLLLGPNGVGKTNILEAISLMAPGRGLRGVKYDNLLRNGSEKWRVTYRANTKLGIAEFTNDFSSTQRRHVSYNGAKISNLELTNFVNVIWLTPQMEGIFLEGGLERRKFFDRLVYQLFPEHASNVAKFDYYQTKRLKELQQHGPNYKFLGHYETRLQELSNTIKQCRLELKNHLLKGREKLPENLLRFDIEIINPIDELLCAQNYSDIMASERAVEYQRGRMSYSRQKDDFMVHMPHKNMPAKFCSTGEQKALLISLFLSHMLALPPEALSHIIFLFDELFVHLDCQRAQYLLEFIRKTQGQIFITATDTNNIADIRQHAQIIKIV